MAKQSRKSPPRQLPYAKPSAAPVTVRPLPPLPTWGRALMLAGPLLFFAVGCAFGFLEVHSSTDTWIGLAGARQIMAVTDFTNLRATFPKADTFSHTFHGQTWYNQNWLAHVYLWLLYDNLGRNWVIYGTWALCVGIFTAVLVTVRIRCGSWLPAICTGALVAIATRDWVSPRPATAQFFCLALCWLALSAIIMTEPANQQSEPAPWWRRMLRAWPIALLTVLLPIWGNAHGSFVIGYLLIGAVVGSWLGLRLIAAVSKKPLRLAPDWLIGALLGVTLLTVLVIGVFGPFGWENFTHYRKIAESLPFRQVGEWQPPTAPGNFFPPVARFWRTLMIAAAALAISGLMAVFQFAIRARMPEPGAKPRYGWHQAVLDAFAVAVGLYLALTSRRFAPLLYILAAPGVTTWVLLICRSVEPLVRRRAAILLSAACWPGALYIASETWTRAKAELIEPFKGAEGYDLLDRVTRLDGVPRDALAFLRESEAPIKLLTEWTLSGAVMFFVPNAQVFMDGRAQQLYSEAHYLLHGEVMGPEGANPAFLRDVLDRTGTDTVLTLRTERQFLQWLALTRLPEWKRVYADSRCSIFTRRGSPLFEATMRRDQAGKIDWPAYPGAKIAQANLALNRNPPDPAEAERLLREALEDDRLQGVEVYPLLVQALVLQQKWQAAEAFIARERRGLTAAAERADRFLIAALNAALAAAEAELNRARTPVAPASAP